jgi:hypothetical protein
VSVRREAGLLSAELPRGRFLSPAWRSTVALAYRARPPQVLQRAEDVGGQQRRGRVLIRAQRPRGFLLLERLRRRIVVRSRGVVTLLEQLGVGQGIS